MSIPSSLEAALCLLQTPSTPFEVRMGALRQVQAHVEDRTTAIDSFSRQRINQTVLENILEIILKEERSSDLYKRQLMRAECFLILSNLLGSSSLFRDTQKKIDDVLDANKIDEVEYKRRNDVILGAGTAPYPSSPTRGHGRSGALPEHDSDDKPQPSLSQIQAQAQAMLESDGHPNPNPHHHHHHHHQQQQQQQEHQHHHHHHHHNHSPPHRSKHRDDFSLDSVSAMSTTSGVSSKLGSSVMSKSMSEVSILKAAVKQAAHTAKVRKKLRSRPSVFYGDRFEADNVVPGVDPTDWIEQDKKLGYQKSRMWFPVGLDPGGGLLPLDRPGPEKQLVADRIVQEYMQMKALLSYVGDLVAPFSKEHEIGHPAVTAGNAAPALPTGGFSKRIDGVVHSKTHDQAVRQAMKIWTPLIGAHLPEWVRKRQRWTEAHSKQSKILSAAGTAAAAQAYSTNENGSDDHSVTTTTSNSVSLASLSTRGSIAMLGAANYSTMASSTKTLPTQSSMAADSPAKPKKMEVDTAMLENKIVFTKGVLRRLLRKELQGSKSTSQTLKQTLEAVIEDEVDGSVVDKYQSKIQSNLQSEKETVQSSMEALRSLTRETIRMQYAMLPPRYLLVVDSKRTNPRKLVARLITIFCQVRRASLLALAFGTWKICLVVAESLARRPRYAKTAAIHLMVGWIQNARFKQMKSYAKRWSKEVMNMIFKERWEAAVPLQTLYRTWRDRRKLIRMAKMATYNGPLSDIYLAPYRPNVRYAIPKAVREAKRLIWMSAVLIQSAWKSLKFYRIFQFRRKQVILLQSISRMWPLRVRFLLLRATSVKVQAWMRRTVKRNQYTRLRRATIVVQKYVRRYLAILKKWRLLNARWKVVEAVIYAAIKIQCRWRIFVAKRRVARIVFNRKRRQWAALVLQRTWYKQKKSLHTFLLMGCYRELDAEEVAFMKFITNMGRFKAAKKIQTMYRDRFFRRMISSVVKVQCWFRGRLGYNLMDIMRREKWASRKLHHWARGMMRRKHAKVRKIQRAWWRMKAYRLRRHLHYKAWCMDREEDRRNELDRHHAASRIQAFAHGVWTRRWFKRHRAALTIQRPLRFYLARLRWKAEIKERNLGAIRKYVSGLLTRGVKDRTLVLVRTHSRMIAKPQALIRGFIVRSIMRTARAYAFKFGIAVVTIQRFWRRSGTMSQAVEVIMAMKRANSNPFRACEAAHDVMMRLHDLTTPYYSLRDPRVGLRLSCFLHRIGHMELLGMFPKKTYLNTLDLRYMTMEKMVSLYHAWQKRMKAQPQHLQNQQQAAAGLSQKHMSSKKKNEPIEVFQKILDIVNPPLLRWQPEHKEAIMSILPVTEWMVPSEFFDMVMHSFGRKFGRNLVARANNVSMTLTEQAWLKFNNYKTLTEPLTKAMVMRALHNASDSAEVKSALDEIRTSLSKSEDDKNWEGERVKECVVILQFAIDKLKDLLPAESKMVELLDKAVSRAAAFRRKISYVVNRMQVLKQQQQQKEYLRKLKGGKHHHRPSLVDEISIGSGGSASKGKSKAGAAVKDVKASQPPPPSQPPPANAGAVSSTDANTIATNEANEIFEEMWTMTPAQRNHKLSVIDSVELEYHGSEENAELEKNIGVCKILMDSLDKIFKLTRATSTLKFIYKRWAIREAVRQVKAKKILDKATEEYLDYRQANHVQMVWEKFRRMETSARRLEAIMTAVANKKQAILDELLWVQRYGWDCYQDENGYSYWVDRSGKEASTYEMPVYSLHQYRQLLKLQRRVRRLLRALELRRKLKEEARLRELARIEARWAESNSAENASKVVKVRLHFKIRNMGSFVRENVAEANNLTPDIESNIEDLLPSRLRLRPVNHLVSGSWALLQPEDASNRYGFELCMVCRVRDGGSVCDAKFLSGKKLTEIRSSRIFEMSIEQGSVVEARHKGNLDFYRGKVVFMTQGFDGNYRYTVLYDDGEREINMTRDLLRMSSGVLSELLKERNARLMNLEKQRKREAHFKKLKLERLQAVQVGVIAAGEDFISGLGQTVAVVSASKKKRGQAAAKAGKGLLSALPGAGGGSVPAGPIKAVSAGTGVPDLRKMLRSSRHLSLFKDVVTVEVRYIRAIRFGWVADKLNGELVYKNLTTFDVTQVAPRYTAAEDFAAMKIQSLIRMRLARLRFKKKLFSDPIPAVVSRAVLKAKRTAFIGYGLEGATPFQILRRLGYFEVADAMEAALSKKKAVMNTLTIDKLALIKSSEHQDYGIPAKRADLSQELVKFQHWWKKSSPAERDSGMAFINYYSGVDDPRSIQKCVAESEESIVVRFLSSFPSHEKKTRASLKKISTSLFPHGKMQIENYISKYQTSPELARESIFELVDKATTHTWVEELEVFKALRSAARQCGVFCGLVRIKCMRKEITAAEKKADSLVSSAVSVSKSGKRPLCSGPEAKAALVLRYLMDYLRDCFKACLSIQRRARCFIGRRSYLKLLSDRKRGIDMIQRSVRGYLGRCRAYHLRRQQEADWEQLWDMKRGLMYYYNRKNITSTYVEPDEVFRPLVRDRLSAMLVQAWPHLDAHRGGSLLDPSIDASVLDAHNNNSLVVFRPASALCKICSVRRCVRFCVDCGNENPASQEDGNNLGFPYCYLCFNQTHENERSYHQYIDSIDSSSSSDQSLKCSMCRLPATRKCMGLLGDAQIDEICHDLQRAPPERWAPILQNANVGSESKLTLILSSVELEENQRQLTAAQLDHIRDLLERTRAECDECYCASCYAIVHTKGKRSLHRWKGFRENAPVCAVCSNAPAETNCRECDSIFCDSCFPVFHGMGRKRRHKKSKLMEEIATNAEVCELCQRRQAVHVCDNRSCEMHACDSCFECIHKPKCDLSHKRDSTTASRTGVSSKGSSRSLVLSSKTTAPPLSTPAPELVCVTCGEPADSQCLQCGDYYCSLKWMGNPGCFANYHSRGNRLTHICQRLEGAADTGASTGRKQDSESEGEAVETKKKTKKEKRRKGSRSPGAK